MSANPTGSRSYEAMADAMARVARAANPEWWSYMSALIVEVARRQKYFYTDDIETLRRERNGPETHEQRAIGPLMRAAKAAGIMVRTNHLMPGRWDKKVWRSKLYRPTSAKRQRAH